MTTPRDQKVIFSGIQPSGDIHLGNYLGAVRHWAPLARSAHCIYCIVDLHAITVPQNPDELKRSVQKTLAALLAAGIDPEESVVFAQSANPDHAVLAWILSCQARFGWLNRMTQFKEKSGENAERFSVGLYTYPVLMAADILVHRGTHVPVGEDQRQHLELSRDIARRFNEVHGVELFPQPEPIIQDRAARVMSLKDARTKMSKSDPSAFSRITFEDDDETVVRKIRKAKTDPLRLPSTVEALTERPEAANLLGILAALEERPLDDVVARFADQSFRELKEHLCGRLNTVWQPLRERYLGFLAEPHRLQDVLEHGASRARASSAPVVEAVMDAVGLSRPPTPLNGYTGPRPPDPTLGGTTPPKHARPQGSA